MHKRWMILGLLLPLVCQGQIHKLDDESLIKRLHINELKVFEQLNEEEEEMTFSQSFNEAGQMSEIKATHTFGSLDSRKMTYNEHGDLLTNLWLSPYGDTVEYQQLEYKDTLLLSTLKRNGSGQTTGIKNTYDRKNRRISSTILNNGNAVLQRTFSYNSDNEMIHTEALNSEGVTQYEILYSYEEGLLRREMHKKNGGHTIYSYSYNTAGKMIQKATVNEAAETVYAINYKYSPTGKLLSEKSDDPDGENYERTFIYDTKDRLLYTKYEVLGKGISREFTHSYLRGDSPTTTFYFQDDFEGKKVKHHLGYTDAGQLISEKHFDADSEKLEYEMTLKYDENGLLTGYTTKNELNGDTNTVRIEYTYY